MILIANDSKTFISSHDTLNDCQTARKPLVSALPKVTKGKGYELLCEPYQGIWALFLYKNLTEGFNMFTCEHNPIPHDVCEECQEEDRLECLAIDREDNKYTWDDVCYTNNCTHDNPKCGAWEELNYTETLDYYN